MKGYTTRDVSNLLGLSVRQAQEYGRSGILDPERTPDHRYLFSFQDLVLLRTAKGLLDARVPQRRILRSLRRLKSQLPRGRSLAEIRIVAEGEDLVVYDGSRAWDAESGQLRLVFDVADLAERVAPMARRTIETAARSEDAGAAEWLELAVELETHAPAQARRAYQRALALEPDNVDALVNMGRLLHEDGEVEGAAELYRRALESSGGDQPTAAFNLGIALEDLGRMTEAAAAYRRAITAEPSFADAHYNLSRVCERLGDRLSALRHLKSYRSLTSGAS